MQPETKDLWNFITFPAWTRAESTRAGQGGAAALQKAAASGTYTAACQAALELCRQTDIFCVFFQPSLATSYATTFFNSFS